MAKKKVKTEEEAEDQEQSMDKAEEEQANEGSKSKKSAKKAKAEEKVEGEEQSMDKGEEAKTNEGGKAKKSKKKKGKEEAGSTAGTEKGTQAKKERDQEATQEAIKLILDGIDDPNSQKNDKAFVPTTWASHWKEKLGPYKKFLQAHPETFFLVYKDGGNFIVKRTKDVTEDDRKKSEDKPVLIKGKTWQKAAVDAWMAYCLAVPREDRDFDQFLSAFPKAAREAKADQSARSKENSAEGGKKRGATNEEAPTEPAKKKKKKASKAE